MRSKLQQQQHKLTKRVNSLSDKFAVLVSYSVKMDSLQASINEAEFESVQMLHEEVLRLRRLSDRQLAINLLVTLSAIAYGIGALL